MYKSCNIAEDRHKLLYFTVTESEMGDGWVFRCSFLNLLKSIENG